MSDGGDDPEDNPPGGATPTEDESTDATNRQGDEETVETGLERSESDPSAHDGSPRRLHPRTILYRLGSSGLRIGVVLLFVGLPSLSGLLGAGDPLVVLGATAVVLGVLAAVVGYAVVAYRRFEYELTADTFDIREGVLARREREIPLRRIQNVDVSQRLPQRLLGIAEVSLETAGGGSTEGRLRYVGVEEAERLQTTISRLRRAGAGETGEAAGDEQAAEPLFEITLRELVVLGIVSVDLRLVSALAIGASVFVPSAPRFVDPQFIGGPEGFIAALLGPAASLVALVVFALGASVLNTTRYVGFRLERAGDELRYERGLFQRYNGTIPLSKVQSLTVEETVLARTFGYASLTIETAGNVPGSGGSSEGSQSAIPLATRDRVFELARSIEDEGDLVLSRPPKRTRTRYLARYTVLVALLTGGFWLLTHTGLPLPPWYVPLFGLALVPVAAHLKWSNRGYALGEDHVVTQNGFWTRERRVVPYHRVQTVFTTATVFQRRRDLATLVVDTAGSTSLLGGDARAVDVDAETAASLREAIPASLYEARRRQRTTGSDRVGDDRLGT